MTSQSEQAVSLLRDRIERGAIPPGAMVSERGLMDLTGLGRTPVREAIQRLVTEHLLRVHPGRGIEVPAVTVEDQLCALEVRRATEVLAVALACDRATATELTAMADLAQALDARFSLEDYPGTVRQTHALIIRAAHNPYLDAVMTPLQSLSRRFWLTHVKDAPAEIAQGKALHQRILRAIAGRDTGAAQRASRDLNDYLVAFALAVVAGRARPVE